MSGTFNPPDFDDMMSVAETIKELTVSELSLKNLIKEAEARVVLEATFNDEYFVNGKPPAMNYISSTYKVTGFDGEISALRDELTNVTADLEFNKRKFEILTGMKDAWQTESANLRKVTI